MMTVYIECDGCGESAQTSTQHDAGTNEIDGVIDEGWIHSSAEDFCPKCAEEEA
jgi:hypothetical protein